MNKKSRQPFHAFRYTWAVPEGGYRCELAYAIDDKGHEAAKPEMMVFEPTPVGIPRTIARHHDLEETRQTGLFLHFADHVHTSADVLAFADEYGDLGKPLTGGVLPKAKGEPALCVGSAVSAWLRESAAMRRLLPLWFTDRKPEIAFHTTPEQIIAQWPPSKDVRKPSLETVVRRDVDPNTYERLTANPSECARHYLRAQLNAKLTAYPSNPRLLPEAKALGGVALFIVPSSLIASLWLQLSLAIDGNRQYQPCKHCKRWFQIGDGGRRTDSETCSSSCRAAAWNKQQKGGAR